MVKIIKDRESKEFPDCYPRSDGWRCEGDQGSDTRDDVIRYLDIDPGRYVEVVFHKVTGNHCISRTLVFARLLSNSII